MKVKLPLTLLLTMMDTSSLRVFSIAASFYNKTKSGEDYETNVNHLNKSSFDSHQKQNSRYFQCLLVSFKKSFHDETANSPPPPLLQPCWKLESIESLVTWQHFLAWEYYIQLFCLVCHL